jgi:hypothetical protein
MYLLLLVGALNHSQSVASPTVGPHGIFLAGPSEVGAVAGAHKVVQLDSNGNIPTSGALSILGAVTSAGVLLASGSSGLPSAVSTNMILAGGFSSPITGRFFIGDGTGKKAVFSKRTGGVTTDVTSLDDAGNLITIGTLKATVPTGIGTSAAAGFAAIYDTNGNLNAGNLYRLKSDASFMGMWFEGDIAQQIGAKGATANVDMCIVKGAKTLASLIVLCPLTAASGTITFDIFMKTTPGATATSILSAPQTLACNGGANWSTISGAAFATTAIPDGAALILRLVSAPGGCLDLRADLFE